MHQAVKTFRKSFFVCLCCWLLVGGAGAVSDMIANQDYTTGLLRNVDRFGFYYSWVLASWWLIMLGGSLLPAIVCIAFRMSYDRWRASQ